MEEEEVRTLWKYITGGPIIDSTLEALCFDDAVTCYAQAHAFPSN